MAKAVLISIRPRWCELIASGKKTIEVRKTCPKIETPFKCYIYCTKDQGNKGSATHFFESEEGTFWSAGKTFAAFLSGTVIGEFVCDSIFPLSFYASDASFFDTEPPLQVPGTCLTDKEIAEYLGNGKTGYGWHISDLVIYDEPKRPSEFKRHDPTYDFSVFGEVSRTYTINRPPQSWCYVEELI